MALIKENNEKKLVKRKVEPCDMDTKDCMFLNKSNGNCSAEWCIFKELPKMVRLNVKLTCEVCKSKTTTVSIYSGETKYICNECLKNIDDVINHPKCSRCGTSTSIGKYLCSSCIADMLRDEIGAL